MPMTYKNEMRTKLQCIFNNVECREDVKYLQYFIAKNE